jgi:hypothetical protein
MSGGTSDDGAFVTEKTKEPTRSDYMASTIPWILLTIQRINKKKI